jgi:hypothetical protein
MTTITSYPKSTFNAAVQAWDAAEQLSKSFPEYVWTVQVEADEYLVVVDLKDL